MQGRAEDSTLVGSLRLVASSTARPERKGCSVQCGGSKPAACKSLSTRLLQAPRGWCFVRAHSWVSETTPAPGRRVAARARTASPWGARVVGAAMAASNRSVSGATSDAEIAVTWTMSPSRCRLSRRSATWARASAMSAPAPQPGGRNPTGGRERGAARCVRLPRRCPRVPASFARGTSRAPVRR